MAIPIKRVSPQVSELATAHNTLQRATLTTGATAGPSATGTAASPTHTHTLGTPTTIVVAGHERITNAQAPQVAAGTCTIVTDVLLADGAQIIAAQPVVPCKLNVIVTDADASISAGTVALVGVGTSGQAVTQTITLAAGTVTTTHAFASLTSATVAGLAGHGAGDNIAIGVSGALGIPAPQGSTAFAVHRASVDDVYEAVGTVDAVAMTLVPTTAPNGARDFDVWWNATVTPAATTSAPSATVAIPTSAHTHMITANAAIHNDVSEYVVTHAACTNAATAYTLLNNMRALYDGDADMVGLGFAGHRLDTLAHTLADSTNVMTVARNSATLATAYLEANELKAVYNAHMTQAGVHRNNDTVNTVTAPDANTEGSLVTLCNDIRVQLLAHMADGFAGAALRVVDA